MVRLLLLLDAHKELLKNLFEMFVYNVTVRKVFEEEMDLNYD